MALDENLKRTPLYDLHLEYGGRMVSFAGWQMPIQYTGVIDEHRAVRTRVGLFDVSHMGQAEVRGQQALGFLQHLTCNNVAKLFPGRAQYTALTTPLGTFVDDLLIYQRSDNDYLLVLNAANTAKDLAWLHEHAADFDVEVQDASSRWALLAVQGPRALATVQPLVDIPLKTVRYYHFVEAEVAGRGPCIVSRTGYTGEDGFEIYVPSDGAPDIWRAVMRAGAEPGIAAVGLGARDTLRLEAKLALYGNDIDETTSVLEADLGWIVKWKKGDFLGRDALCEQRRRGLSRRLVGFEMRGRAIARHGYPARHRGQEVGRVTSGSHAPFLKKNIGLAYLPIGLVEPGTEFEIAVRGRPQPAVVVPTPFYKRIA